MSFAIAVLSFVAVVSAILAIRNTNAIGFFLWTAAAGGCFATAVYLLVESLNKI